MPCQRNGQLVLQDMGRRGGMKQHVVSQHKQRRNIQKNIEGMSRAGMLQYFGQLEKGAPKLPWAGVGDHLLLGKGYSSVFIVLSHILGVGPHATNDSGRIQAGNHPLS